MSFDVSAQLMCEIDLVIANAKSQVKQSVNTAMGQAYWQIGRLIVEQEAKEKTRPLATTAKDDLRDPYILYFLNLQDKTYQESDLEQGIISNLQQFLLELGKGFAFVERQQRTLANGKNHEY